MEDEPIYLDGWPEQQGWFDCLIDGTEPDRLRHWICPIAGRHHWVSIDNQYIEALHQVTYTGEATAYP